ncbi:MAG: hypothetical protein GY795_11550 [Desulfobacterales bacterium]|nr:hypothetical protein [Desulfobacterales bacterium]
MKEDNMTIENLLLNYEIRDVTAKEMIDMWISGLKKEPRLTERREEAILNFKNKHIKNNSIWVFDDQDKIRRKVGIQFYDDLIMNRFCGINIIDESKDYLVRFDMHWLWPDKYERGLWEKHLPFIREYKLAVIALDNEDWFTLGYDFNVKGYKAECVAW